MREKLREKKQVAGYFQEKQGKEKPEMEERNALEINHAAFSFLFPRQNPNQKPQQRQCARQSCLANPSNSCGRPRHL
jgi:hypothetical protein